MPEREVKINNTQRREFAKIADRIIQDKMEQCSKDDRHVEMVARQKAAETLASELDDRIAILEEHIERLRKEKEALGFGKYDHIIPGSKADELIQDYRKDSRKKLHNLRQLRDDVKERLWASQTLREAQSVMVELRSL